MAISPGDVDEVTRLSKRRRALRIGASAIVSLAVTLLLVLMMQSVAGRDGTDPRVGDVVGSSSESVVIGGDIEGEARIPPGWSYIASAPGEHAVLGLAASPRSSVVEGLVRGHPDSDSYGFRSVDLEALDPDTAFVDVVVTYVLTTDEQEIRFPESLDPDMFVVSESVLGEPVREFVGEGRDRGIYRIRYWAGPEAGNEVRDETRALIRDLRLPGF